MARDTSFQSLPLSQQIEFAAFRYIDTHPSDIRWRLLLARGHNPQLVPELVKALASEKSDNFAIGLISLLMSIEREVPSSDYEILEAAALRRLAVATDDDLRWVGYEILRQIRSWADAGTKSAPESEHEKVRR